MLVPCELVVFDLDGTLIDSRRDLADAVNGLLAERGAPPLPLDEVTSYVGEGAAVLVRRALAAAGLDPDAPGALDRFLVHYDRRLTAFTRPYAGIPETLDSLRQAGVPLAVLTNKPEGASRRILDLLGLSSNFHHVVGGDSRAGRKPDPAGLLGIVEASRATPSSTLLVGDSPIDLHTARNAGTRICLARYGFGYRFTGRDFRGDEFFVDNPLQIPAIVNSQFPPPNCPENPPRRRTR